ncbi:flavodoxin family protein [Tessaracoccus oleiagri]|uniref:Flavodoxin n=1 Tax=Tessaracoccus oleiagri TaxID=686624 RepID=A0A1G9JSS5_9ACTN|nr:flavodoxin domain-containing protein [Tessaracoccus oleiagri]SDL40589.1 Flavodoxin [Tessaracoccus oleiagri]
MKSLVIYESLWGNTAAVAQAIAEGIGDGVKLGSTGDVTSEDVADADLIVAGAPVFAFHLSSDRVREDIEAHPDPGAPPPDLSHPSLRSWLDSLPAGTAACAAFDTQVRGPFGKGAPTIAKAFTAKGYRLLAKPEGFYVEGKQGPLRRGEVDRARRWGEELRRLCGSQR